MNIVERTLLQNFEQSASIERLQAVEEQIDVLEYYMKLDRKEPMELYLLITKIDSELTDSLENVRSFNYIDRIGGILKMREIYDRFKGLVNVALKEGKLKSTFLIGHRTI